MSDEQVVGSIGWSPDFKSQPENNVQKLLDDGVLKLAPLLRGDKLISADLVKAGDDQPEPVEEGVGAYARPHQKDEPEPSWVTLIGHQNARVTVQFTYTNWKGVTSRRKAIFWELQFGKTDYHPEEQLLVCGFDVDKQARRTYAVKDISDLRPI
jgi:hypothetical protein